MGSAQDYFRTILITVVGQAFDAGGYALLQEPIRWAGGQFRFTRKFDDGATATIAFQLLAYTDTEWAVGNPSRFRVMLSHSDGRQRDLSALVVEDFGVAILPDAQYWWMYRNVDELGKTLAEAGHLVIGYGLPWLSGELMPPTK